MNNAHLLVTCLALVGVLVAGCESTAISRRISENPATFAKLAPDQKAYVRDGIVFPGDSVEMAYMALGEPDSVETRERDDIKVIMWTYKKYYPAGELADFLTEYSRSRNPNLRRILNIEPGSGTISDSVPNAANHHIRTRGGRSHGSGTDTYDGVNAGVSMADLPVYKLYVFYYREKISDVMIESIDGTILSPIESTKNPPSSQHFHLIKKYTFRTGSSSPVIRRKWPTSL